MPINPSTSNLFMICFTVRNVIFLVANASTIGTAISSIVLGQLGKDVFDDIRLSNHQIGRNAVISGSNQ